MTSIKQLIDKDGNPIFPVTHTNAIFDSEGNKIEDRLSNIVNKTKNTKHITENGVKEFSCKDGYVDNIAIEGQTLVNLSDRYNVRTDDDDGISRLFFTQQKRCTNGIYTCFNFTDKPIAFNQRTLANETYVSQTLVNANSYKVIQVNADNVIYGVDFQPIFGWSNEDASIYTSSMFAVLEGDYSDKPISYFEGLKSVGQGDKIDVVSYKIGSENLASNLTFTEGEYVDSVEGDTHSHGEFKCSNEYIEVEGGCAYLFDNINGQFAIYDTSKLVIPTNWQDIKDDWITGDNYQSTFIYIMPKNAKYVRINLPISNLKPYSLIKTKSDKKQISTTLRSLPNGVKDTIEKRGNKYVKVQRCKEIVLNGNENWTLHIPNDSWIQFKSDLISDVYGYNSLLIADRERCTKNDVDALGIKFGGSEKRLFYRIDSSKLSTQDVEGFKTWLQSNPITVVYELATPQIIELPNFNPQTYEGDTTLLLNTGVIQGECEFEVTNSMGSEIEVLKDKVSALDDHNYYFEGVISDNTNKITQLNNTIESVQLKKLTDSSGAFIRLTDGTNIDTIYSGCNDILNATGTLPGSLVSTNNNILIECKRRNDSYVRQICYDVRSINSWERVRVNGTWSAWRSL